MAGLMLSVLLLGGANGLLQHDPFSQANEVFLFSFERDEDRDFDGQPDDWTRRRGPLFPAYVRTEIDRDMSQHGSQSLRVDVNGGRVTYYSPPKQIDALHAYVFEGYIRTQRLKHDAALFSLSFLNHKRQRIQRTLSRPVSGTHSEWVRVRIGPVFPKEDVRFVVVGCHLVPQKRKDLRGQVWFDALRLGQTPQLSLATGFDAHFKPAGSPMDMTAEVGGLEADGDYRLRFQLYDGNGTLVEQELRSLADSPNAISTSPDSEPPQPLKVVWKLPAQPRGFYRVLAALERDGDVMIEKLSSFLVMDFVEPQGQGEFGWSLAQPPDGIPLQDLADMATQSGISWLKYPLWQTVESDWSKESRNLAELFDTLSHRRMTVVGVLNNPPDDVRRKLPSDQNGVGRLFTMHETLWWPSVRPVVARYSSHVRHWQLGGDTDHSLVPVAELPETVRRLKTRFDTVARDIRIGIPWDTATALPARKDMPHAVFTLVDTERFESGSLQTLPRSGGAASVPRWVSLKPLPKKQPLPEKQPPPEKRFSVEQRGSDLVKRLTAARASGADAVFLHDVLHPQHGVLNDDGSPTPLYLPWRTAALALRGAKYLGSLQLPGGSTNYVFERDGEGIVVLWNPEPTTEELWQGTELLATDIEGRKRLIERPPNRKTQAPSVKVGTVPLILQQLPAAMLRWQLATRFEVEEFESRRGKQSQTLVVTNTFSQEINGRVSLEPPRGWSVQPKSWEIRLDPGEQRKLPMTITVPPYASQGVVPVAVNFRILAERVYRFRVRRTFRVVMGDVAIKVVDRKRKDGRLEIQQIITNNTQPEQVLSFRCMLLAPGVRRQRRLVSRMGRGKDRRVYILPDAEALRGETLWIRAEQIGGSRVLNLRWKALDSETISPSNEAPSQPPLPTTRFQ